jgi:hypothetical protein
MKNIDTFSWVCLFLAVVALVGIVWKFGFPGVAMLAIFDAFMFVALKRTNIL